MPNEVSAINSLPGPAGRASRLTAVQQIYTDLRQLIVGLTLPPGTVISKNDIADRYGVSQTPVREALILLEEDGLVDIFPQSRTEVSRIDIQHAREVHFLRLSVEIEIARVLSQTIDQEGMDRLRERIDKLSVNFNDGDQPSFMAMDNDFHEEMFRLAGIGGLTRMLHRRRGHYDRIRGLYLMEQERRSTVIKEHKKIFDAIAKHDATAAEAAVRTHLGKSLAIIDQIQDRYPDYFV